MKFTASSSSLRQALQRAKVATQGRNFLPAASCVWMGPYNNSLQIACSNGSMQVIERVLVETESDDDSSMVNCRHLLDAVNRLGGEIEIESKGGKLEIRRGESSVVIPEEKADGFAWLKTDSGQSFQMPENELRMSLRRVSPSIYDLTGRPEMRAVLIELEPNKILFGASDGKVIVKTECQFQHELQSRIALPREAALALVTLLGESENIATIKISEAMIEISFGNTVFTSKLAAEEFPNIHRAFKLINPPQFQLVLNREEWIDALDLISTAKDESKWTGADVELKDGKITLSASGTSSAQTSIVAKFKGSLNFRVDAGLLMDILSGLDGPTFTLELTDHLDPLVIRAVAFVGLVCPLRK